MRRPALLVLLLLGAVAGTLAVASGLLSSNQARSGRAERETPSQPPLVPPTAPPPRERDPLEGGGGGRASWRLEGRVTGPEGRGIGGARVVWGEARTTSAADGAYALEAAPIPSRLAVAAEGYLPVVEAFLPREAPPWRRDFTLAPAASVSGRVTGEGGLPEKGATVYVIAAGHAFLDLATVANTALTDEDGRYLLPGVAAGPTDLGARAAGYLPRVERDVVVPAQGRLAQDFALRRGRTVFAQVLEEPPETSVLAWDGRLRDRLLTGDGVEGLADALVGRSFELSPVVRGVRVGDRFVLAGLSPAPADILAQAPGFLAEPGSGLLLGTLREEVTLSLIQGKPVRIEARDAATGKLVTPSIRRKSDGLKEPVDVEREADGTISLPADDRRHTLLFAADGYEPASLELPDLRREPPAPLFRIHLTPVVEEASGSFFLVPEPPFAGRMSVVGLRGDGSTAFVLHLPEADGRGRWMAAPVPLGEFRVTVLATGKVPFTIPRVVVTETLEETHSVRFSDGGGLALTVRDAEGNLLDQVHLMLVEGEGRRIPMQILTLVSEGGRGFVSIDYIPSAASAKSDSGLAPGSYTLTAVRDGYRAASKPFEIRGSEVAEVDLTLSRR